MSVESGRQWWLAELDMHGNPTLVDGAHEDRAGADNAMYVYERLRITHGKRYAVALVILYQPQPNSDGVDEEVIDILLGRKTTGEAE